MPGVLHLVRQGRFSVETRLVRARPGIALLGGMATSDESADLVDDFADANGAVEYAGSRGKRNRFDAGSDQYCGGSFHESLDSGIVGEAGGGLQNDGGGALIFGEGAARVVGGVHAESVYAKFAEFGANAGAQRPVGGDHENCVHRSRIKHERRKRSAFRHYFSSTACVAHCFSDT